MAPAPDLTITASRSPAVHLSVAVTAQAGRNDGYIVAMLESLFRVTRGAPFTLRVTVVDNSPGLGLAARLRTSFPGIEVIENATRRGFAANHNAALRGSSADFFLVANDDLVFLPGAIERAIAYATDAAHARVGVVAFQLLNPDRSVQPSTYSFPTVPRALLDLSGLRRWVPFGPLMSRLAALVGRGAGRSRFWAHDRTLPVDTVAGALMLVRAAAVRDVGPMDEVTLIGGEETEWHRRFRDRGWSVVFLHDAPVIHLGSQTLAVSPELEAEYLKGVLNFFAKHRAPAVYALLRALVVPALAVRALTYLADPGRALLAPLWRVAWTWRAS